MKKDHFQKVPTETKKVDSNRIAHHNGEILINKLLFYIIIIQKSEKYKLIYEMETNCVHFKQNITPNKYIINKINKNVDKHGGKK